MRRQINQLTLILVWEDTIAIFHCITQKVGLITIEYNQPNFYAIRLILVYIEFIINYSNPTSSAVA